MGAGLHLSIQASVGSDAGNCSNNGNGSSSISSSSSSTNNGSSNSLLRRVSSAISKNFDSLITPLLQDGDMHVQQQRPDWATDEDGVLPQALEFRARNKLVVPHLRRFWAIACLVGMCVWLFIDVYLKEANGLVPGLKDTYIIESTPFSEARGDQEEGTTTICSCTYNSTNYYAHLPFTMLVVNAGKAPPSFLDFLNYCENPFNTTMPNRSTDAGRFLIGVLDEYFYQMSSIRLLAPTSAILLPVEGWRAARFAEAFRASMVAMTAAQARISSTPPELLSDEALNQGLDLVTRLQVSFSAVLGKLLEMPDHAMTTEMVDTYTNQSTPLQCTPPNKTDLPLALLEWCRPPGVYMMNRLTNEDDNRKDCSDPYEAYVSWCAPTLCHILGPKPPYLQAMQVMAALGGLYSIISLFAFAIAWRLVFCSFERKVDLDGCLRRCFIWIRGVVVCCLIALGCSSQNVQHWKDMGWWRGLGAVSSVAAAPGAGPGVTTAVRSGTVVVGGSGSSIANGHCVCQIDELTGTQGAAAADVVDDDDDDDTCKLHAGNDVV